MSKCAVEDCDRDARTRGWCLKHYKRWLVHGDPLIVESAKPRPATVAIGDTFGRWTVIAESKVRQGGKRMYLCRCECGTENLVSSGNLRGGKSKSCGCYKHDVSQERWQGNDLSTRHGHTTTANGRRTPTYRSWCAMINRTTRPTCNAWKNYGGRGITVCERWESFDSFLADMGERPEGKTLDRIDVDGNYEPSNCRWATAAEQRANQRPKAAA